MSRSNAMGSSFHADVQTRCSDRRRNDGARLDTGKRMSRREAGFWLGLFAGITVGGLGTSYYYSETPVASPAPPTPEVSTASAFEARAGQLGAR